MLRKMMGIWFEKRKTGGDHSFAPAAISIAGNPTNMKTLLHHFLAWFVRRADHDTMFCLYLGQLNRKRRVVKKDGAGWRWV